MGSSSCSVILGSVVVLILSSCQRPGVQPASTSDTTDPSRISEAALFLEEENSHTKLVGRPSATKSALRAHHAGGSYNYGYGQLDALLAYADYARWGDPSIVSVIRVLYGPNASVRNSSVLTGPDRWSFVLDSGHRVSVLRAFAATEPETNAATVSSGGVRVQVTATTNDRRRTGFIMAVHGDQYACVTSSISPNPLWYDRSQDPYASGFTGNFGGSFWYYPPDPCSYNRSSVSLALSGLVNVDQNVCSEGGMCTLMAFSDTLIAADLGTYLNQYEGYFPLFRQDFQNTDVITARFINFNGVNWY